MIIVVEAIDALGQPVGWDDTFCPCRPGLRRLHDGPLLWAISQSAASVSSSSCVLFGFLAPMDAAVRPSAAHSTSIQTRHCTAG